MQTIDNPFVRFKNVQKSYDGETLVVKDLNLDIAAGEFVTMLGPSGSGKTTCLMMLAGFETATHGDIVGVDLVEVSPDYDLSGSTTTLAAQILLNLIGRIHHNRGA